MRNYAVLWERKPTKVGGLHGGRAGRLVNSEGIMEMTVGCRLRKSDLGWQRTEADGSRQI